MGRYRQFTRTTSTQKCENCDWTSGELAMAGGVKHVHETGHTVARAIIKVTTIAPWERDNDRGKTEGRH